jgi:hypothetical protein
MKLGWLLFGIGLVVTVAGIFIWQIAADSPGWNISGLVKVSGIVFIVLGSITGLYGLIRISGRK